VKVGVDCAAGAPSVTGSHVLLAVGRQPNTDDLGLDRAGVELDERGYIRVDDHLRTNIAGIWALGEVNGRGAFTHTAYNDYEIVAANLLDDDDRKVSDRIEAYAIYTDPPLARFGASETAARKTGKKLLVAQRPMTRVMRSVEKGESQGFMKAVVDAETNRILGAAILGVDGDEAIHALLYATYAGSTAKTITRSMGIHPTVSELLPTLLGDLK
jgi:pyruvate/2-oxoglutarate dehydrogenase complex dihydrolipoamide dehydrogenase (E3) component